MSIAFNAMFVTGIPVVGLEFKITCTVIKHFSLLLVSIYSDNYNIGTTINKKLEERLVMESQQDLLLFCPQSFPSLGVSFPNLASPCSPLNCVLLVPKFFHVLLDIRLSLFFVFMECHAWQVD